jgi:hypothetical protein
MCKSFFAQKIQEETKTIQRKEWRNMLRGYKRNKKAAAL